MTPADFRAAFPEFANSATYPDAQVTMWLGIGALLINADRWRELTDFGVQLFTAHNLVLESSAMKAGGGAMKGAISSQSVDKASVSYDTSAGIVPGAGHWNLTTFGARLIQLALLMGSGPIQR